MAEKPDTTNPSARPDIADARRFLDTCNDQIEAGVTPDRARLRALRQSIERTLAAMAALLGDDAPEGVAIPVRAPVRGNQRREA
jgi:hypothetical protein